MNQASLMNQSKRSLSEFWTSRNARERRMLTAAGVVVAAALLYSLFIAPAVSGRVRLNKDLPDLHQQVAQIHELSREAAELAEKQVIAIPVITRESIEAALARKGLKAQSLMVNDGTVQLKLAAASFADTMGWLDEMQKTARLSVVTATVAALPQPDIADVTLALRQQGNE